MAEVTANTKFHSKCVSIHNALKAQVAVMPAEGQNISNAMHDHTCILAWMNVQGSDSRFDSRAP